MTNKYNKQLGANIRKTRRLKELTQVEMAAHCGVSRTAWIAWEKGVYSPAVPMLQLIAKRFGVSINSLLPESDSAPKNAKTRK